MLIGSSRLDLCFSCARGAASIGTAVAASEERIPLAVEVHTLEHVSASSIGGSDDFAIVDVLETGRHHQQRGLHQIDAVRSRARASDRTG